MSNKTLKTRPLTKEEEEAAAERAMLESDLIEDTERDLADEVRELQAKLRYRRKQVPLNRPHLLMRLTDDSAISWHMFNVNHAEVRMTASEFAAFLIKEGYYQVSRKFHILGRLPNGRNGRQALLEIIEEDRQYNHEEWARMLSERDAGDHFLRCHAGIRGNVGKTIEVDSSTFAEFRKQGGGTYR